MLAMFGVSFAIVRGAMLIFGLVPVFALLWFFRRKGFLQSRWEIVQAAYFIACFTFFGWAVHIRPEAVLVTVISLFIFAWASDHSVLLFLTGVLIPLCGLQWNVLLLPVAFHWLIFGGRIRKPILVAVALGLSSVVSITAYHILGMWPSYCHEAARTDGLDALHSGYVKLLDACTHGNFGWLFNQWATTPILTLCFLFFATLGILSVTAFHSASLHRKTVLFLFLSLPSSILALGLCGHVYIFYEHVLFGFALLGLPVLARPLFRYPLFLLPCILLALYPVKINWHKFSHAYGPRLDALTDASWLDDANLEQALSNNLAPDDVLLAPDSAWIAARSHCRDALPLCFAFDLSGKQQRSITAVLLPEEPSSILYKDGSGVRRVHYAKVMCARFCPLGAAPDTIHVSPEELLAAIGEHWNCTFTEIPLEQANSSGFIRYRLFRTVFQEVSSV